MIRALLYLQVFSSWNRLLSQMRRLKRPKYLAGFLVGALYFFLYFIRPISMGARAGTQGHSVLPAELAGAGEVFGAAILLLVVAVAWIFPYGRAALSFTEAEATFLFAAPVRRSTLIHFKLLRSQTGILFTTLLMALLTNRLGPGGRAWIHLAGWWLILSILNLHFLGASFARTRLLDMGVSTRQRRLILFGILLVLSVAAWWWMRHSPPSNRPLPEGFKGWIRYARSFLETEPMASLLIPFRWVVRPYLASSLATFLTAAWPAVMLLAVHFLWVLRSDVAFEEASLELARRRAERIAALRREPGQMRPGKARPAPFMLHPTGLPAVAFLWKNLISAGSLFTARVWMVLAFMFGIPAVILGANTERGEIPVLVSMLLMIAFIWSILLGPQLLRQDFRHDIRSVELLKMYPLPGWQVVLGELLAPTAILSAIQWTILMLLVILFSRIPGGPEVAWRERFAVGLAATFLCPAVNFISLLIPNAGVLLFPAWLQSGPGSPHGIEATGQRLIFLLGQLFVFALALVPALALGVGVYWLLSFWMPWLVVVPLSGLAGTLLLAIEIALGVLLLGRLFERLDASAP
jgi:hypothetical protein